MTIEFLPDIHNFDICLNYGHLPNRVSKGLVE